MSVLSLIQSDLGYKASTLYGSTSRSARMRALGSDGATAVILFRLSESFYRGSMAPFGFALAKLNKIVNGVVIGRGATIGSEFVLQHSIGVVINGTSVIGQRCVIQSGVTIGAHSVEQRSSPRIGDDVRIGSGAKLIGGIEVGDQAQVGANAVLVDDLAAGVTAVGVPARPIKKKT